jgi:hypothetical protein
VQKVQGEGTLVFLQLVIVLVFGKILRHGDEFVPDAVPPVQHLIGRRARGTRRLALRLGLTVHCRRESREHGDRNKNKEKSFHGVLISIEKNTVGSSRQRSARPLLTLVTHFADSIDHSFWLVELDIFRAVLGEDLLGI